MAKEKQVVIKDVEITNNCPECFNQELKLSFYQKHLHTAFYHKITREVTSELKCKKCYTLIYPVSWTTDIERVFEYYNKLAVPNKKSTKFSSLFYSIVFVVIGVIGACIYLYVKNII